EGYFSEPINWTLEPLRVNGAEPVHLQGSGKITKVIVRQTKTKWETSFQHATTDTADDILAAITTGRNPIASGLSKGGTLARAIFLLHFAGSPRSRIIKVRLPNILKLERAADLSAV